MKSKSVLTARGVRADNLPSPFGRGAGGEARAHQRLNHSADGPHPNPLPKGEGTVGKLILAVLGISLLFGFSGCEPGHSPAPPQQTVKAPPPPPPPPPPETSTASSATPAAQTPSAAQPVAKDPNAGSKVAKVGVGKSYSRLSKSLICTDFAALYCVRERLVFEVQIPKAMQLFNATKGRNPKSHAEFMEKIIKEGQIHLPELWEGETYRYDPKTAELWVDPPPQK